MSTAKVATPQSLLGAAMIGALVAATPVLIAPTKTLAETEDPRAGDPGYERSKKLFSVLREILDEAARRRLEQQTDPNSMAEDFVWRQFGLDDDTRVRDLLSSAFEMMTDAPVVEMQDEIAERRRQISRLRDQIAELKEQRISAPEDGGVASMLGLSDDQDSLDGAIAELDRRIEGQQNGIAAAKQRFVDAMEEAGAPIPPEQAEMLLDSVTGYDLVRLAAAYEAVRGVSDHLRRLMDESGEDLTYARRYYGMHTALIALLVEAQSGFLNQIDSEYMPKLGAIEGDIRAAARETQRLLDDDPTKDQRRALGANQRSQAIALDALELYRDYLQRQRDQILATRERTLKELRVADNTLRTVDASFQLREVMESAATSFEALRNLESPGFERLFRNEQLRREFQELTERLAPGS